MNTMHCRGFSIFYVFISLLFSLSALADNSGIYLCTLDESGENHKIYAITNLDKISTWPLIFDFEENNDLMTQVSKEQLSQLRSFFPDRNLTTINNCWNINVTTLVQYYPAYQKFIANSSLQRERNSTHPMHLIELPFQAANAGSRLALRRGYIIGVISLIIFNNFYPQYVYMGWASLIACFLFPNYADSLFDKAVSLGGSLTGSGSTHTWGSGNKLGPSSGEEQTTNVGSSSATVFGGSLAGDAQSIKIKQTGNFYHF